LPQIPDNTSGLRLISLETGAPAVDLASLILPLLVLENIDEEVARKAQVLPLRLDRGTLFVAAAEPNNTQTLDEIAFLSGKKIVAYAAHAEKLRDVLDEAYAARRAGAVVWRGPKAAKPTDSGYHQVVRVEEPAATSVTAAPAAAQAQAQAQARTVPGRLSGPMSPVSAEIREPFVGEPSYHGTSQPPAAPRTRPRILVVDDEPAIRRILQQGLVQRGWEVMEAGNGADTLKLVQRADPDAILLDAMLPDVHGFDICKRLKGSQRYAHIPIIMMTAVYKGWRMAADLKESYGVASVVEKPFDLHLVVKCLEDALSSTPAAKPNVEALSAEAQRLYKDGSEAFRRGDVDAAINLLGGAVQIDPLSALLRHQLGLLYAQKGQDFTAIQELEAAVDLEPAKFQTLRNLAILYQRHGFRRKSCELWERALVVAPDEPTRTEIKTLLVKLL
jgi:DNA-binding response OmpR family regulator